ncbi:hypothetical protein [Corallincola spongiicola]|uniref:Chorismatase FkbO/Hyg5-like N-terminal domain-containing protein n=1 Tax=Corallincola spongiicola TaxID=2520508 RepID=A0ABY1WTM1_9GAMM|nr:hypothetical protein [Corallincola spongiicola]TAA47916.1 hypothetical protein EXY25_01335 [Corallincola spongiicola]
MQQEGLKQGVEEQHLGDKTTHDVISKRVSLQQYAAICRQSEAGILGAVIYGADQSFLAAKLTPIWPQITSSLVPLSGAYAELFISREQPRYWHSGEMILAYNSQVVFGGFDLAVGSLAMQAEARYLQVRRLLSELSFPFIYRMWNELPDINGIKQGTEQYQHFCSGRAEAFATSAWQGTTLPAATAVGSHHSDRFVHYFIAGLTPCQAVENRQQVSAFDYPPQYGRHAPSFTRAQHVESPFGVQLWVSGTASIEGHQSLHLGDVNGQTRLALKNIKRILMCTKQALGCDYQVPGVQAQYRVYLRDPDYLACIQSVVGDELGTAADVSYVAADICRSELLVEIEAVYSRGCDLNEVVV